MSDKAKTTAADQVVAGAPAAKGAPAPAVDEFAHIPSSRTRHPLLAAAAAALAFFLVFHVRADLRYALSPTTPLDLGEARGLFKADASDGGAALAGTENRYVRVRGTPDRESGLELDTKGSWVFSQFFRVLGTGDRLFVHRRENPLPAFRAEEDVFEGRLIRFRDLSFEDSIRAYFTHHVTATHFFAPADLARALAARPVAGAGGGATRALRDRAGDAVTIGPEDELALDVIRPDEVRLGLPRERFADEAAARAAIEQRHGEVVVAQGLVKEEPRDPAASGALVLESGPPPVARWTFVARFPPAERDAALSALGDLDPKMVIRDARETVRARLAQIRAEGDAALVVEAQAQGPGGAPGAAAPGGAPAGPRTLPLPTIAAARTVATVRIPDDAFLVIEGDHPRQHAGTVFIAVVLAMFGAVNLVGLLRELRR